MRLKTPRIRTARPLPGAVDREPLNPEPGPSRRLKVWPIARGARRLPRKESLVAQTLALLRDEIASGAWTRGLPGERKLCEQLLISRGTLRAALATLKQAGLLRGSQGRRWQVARPKWKRLKAGVSGKLVLLTPQPLHVLTPFAIYWIDHLREHLGEAGYRLEVRHERSCYVSHPDLVLATLADQERPAAWVLCGTNAAMQRWFSKRALPCVIIGSRHEGVCLPSVDRDLPAACRHAVGIFLAKGHSRLVLLNRKSGLAGDLECEKAFVEAGAKYRPGTCETLIAHDDGTPQNVCARLNGLLQRQPPPTGFLVSGPKQTLSALGFLIRRGLRLPRDAALIARDDDSFMEYVLPTVARYSIAPMLFARRVSRTVLGLVQGGSLLPRDYRITPEFIPGETCQ